MPLTLGIAGNVITVTSSFKQLVNGLLTVMDPSGIITFTLRSSDAPTLLVETYPASPTIVKDSAGTYHRAYVCATAGEYICEVTAGTGNGQAAQDIIWEMAPSALFN